MNRLSSRVALALLTAALVACGGTGGPGVPGNDGGTGSGNDGGGTDPGNDGGTDPGNDGGTDPGGPTTIAWAGTWIVAVNYGVTCDIGFGNTQTASYSSTFTTTMTGANNSLSAMTDVNYYLSGTGSNSLVLLNGTFPLKGADNQKASTGADRTDLSIRLNAVANANSASGTITGTFKSGFGASCEVQPGATVTFTRGTGSGPTITWAGTWSVAVNYGVTCDIGFGNTKTATYSSTFTTDLTGANTSLTATTDFNYYMFGTGNSILLLNGTFPLKGADNQKASSIEEETDLSIHLDTVADANNASGTITGTFRSGFGASCEVHPGATVTFTRN